MMNNSASPLFDHATLDILRAALEELERAIRDLKLTGAASYAYCLQTSMALCDPGSLNWLSTGTQGLYEVQVLVDVVDSWRERD